MITATINSVTKVMHQESGKYFLDVRFTLTNGDEVMNERSLGFPLDTSADDIKAELAKYCATMESDAARADEVKAFEEANAGADETIAALADMQVTSGDIVKVEADEEITTN